MILQKRVDEKTRGEYRRKAARSRIRGRAWDHATVGRSFTIRLSEMHFARSLLPFVLLILLFLGLLTACAGQQQALNPAGTSTQDPPIPHIIQNTHGIMDTTGTVPQSFLAQMRARSDDVQAHGYQIAVVFFNDLASDPHQFATQVFNNNGIGSKDKNNGVLIVLYLQKPGTDGHVPWLACITGGGISTALPDTLLDDFAQTTFVPVRAQGHWQEGLLAFYDKVYAAERDPSVAQEWQTTHPQPAMPSGPSHNNNRSTDPTVIVILVGIALAGWLVISAVVAASRRKNFFYTALWLLGRLLLVLALLSRSTGRGSSSSRSGSGLWGGGGRSPSSGIDV